MEPDALTYGEAQIVDRLAAALDGWSVFPFPDKPDLLGAPTQIRQCFVAFKRKTAEEPRQIGAGIPITQSCQYDFDILLKAKDLRSHQGIYAALRAIEDALIGFIPVPKSHGMFLRAIEPVEYREGIWLYSMAFSFKLPEQKRR